MFFTKKKLSFVAATLLSGSLMGGSVHASGSNTDRKVFSGIEHHQGILASDSIIYHNGSALKKSEVFLILEGMYQAQAGVKIKALDVFGTNQEGLLAGFILDQSEVKVLYFDSSKVYLPDDSLPISPAHGELAYYADQLSAAYGYKKQPGVDGLKAFPGFINHSEQALIKGFKQDSSVQPNFSEALKEPELSPVKLPQDGYKDKMFMLSHYIKELITNSSLTGYQSNDRDTEKPDLYAFVSHTCPNCVSFFSQYHQNIELYNDKFNVVWIPVGKSKAEDWEEFFGAQKGGLSHFNAEAVLQNSLAFEGLFEKIGSNAGTPAFFWKSSDPEVGYKMVIGKLKLGHNDVIARDMAKTTRAVLDE